ncbi:hypothetical protein ACFL6K_02180 [Candidatus Latescibacterota bacterium]
MEKLNNTSKIILLGFLLVLMSGCSTFITFDSRKMTLDDVISLSKVDLDSDIIILQIESTYSKFRLDTAEILKLKAKGVDDKVIKYMIETTLLPERFSWEYSRSPMNQSYYNFNQSDEDYENSYSPNGSVNGIYPSLNPYDSTVNNQTDFFIQPSPNYGGQLLFDTRLFESNTYNDKTKSDD